MYRFGEPRSSGCMRRRELLWRDQGGVYRAMHMRGRRGARDAHDGARDGRAGGVRCLVLPLLGALLDESPSELHHYARATTLEAAVLRVNVRPAVGYTMTEGGAESRPFVETRDCGVVSACGGPASKLSDSLSEVPDLHPSCQVKSS